MCAETNLMEKPRVLRGAPWQTSVGNDKHAGIRRAYRVVNPQNMVGRDARFGQTNVASEA